MPACSPLPRARVPTHCRSGRGARSDADAAPGAQNDPHPEPRRSLHDQRAKSDVLWMKVFSFEMFTLPKPVVASQPAFAL